MNFFKNFSEAAKFYRSLNREEKNHLILSLGDDLKQISNQAIRLKIVNHFYESDKDFGRKIASQLGLSQQDFKGY